MKSQGDFHLYIWQKHYLQLEAERFEATLKHFFENGMIKPDEYHFLISNMKMIRAFLKVTHSIKQIQKHERPDYWNNANKYKQNFLHKHLKSKKAFSHSDLKQLSLFDTNNPLPIIGKIEVSGLNERLDALKPIVSEKTGPKFPYRIPAGTHWNQVIIKFLNNEQVEIHVKNYRHTADYKEMGFVGKGKIPEPSEQWIFLKVLAQCNGELTIKDDTAKDTYKQQKHLLTESLQNYFSIDFDPFYPYKSSPEKHGNSYRIKLTLLPPPEHFNKPKIETTEEDTLGIKEYLDEHAPQIIES